ncbi:MAG TPA: rRNA maturation RNase YbeY [Bacteroidia bacterium]|nr:rRNA maturation RNase YbeY [Bacteroidia bacterium]HNU33653.1 rRNA maturation RNase YbeY [Bacteroidia bacterium]
MPVLFTKADVRFRFDNANGIRQWIMVAVKKEGCAAHYIQFVFCSDVYLLELNQQYLHHDTLTDIITFDYRDGKKISGDIFISIDRVRENAGKFNVLFKEELHRVMIHGILHLCGYKDKDKKNKLLMTEKENFYLERL